jgi:4-diphosphocytidyl-2-C-methyl-D-erythritol kinase
MIDFPNGKINIGLSITEKRPDGFHNLETIMYPIKIHDILEIIISPRKLFSFTSSGIKVAGEIKDNLVCKAYELLKRDFNLPAVKIHLHKAIPHEAGLGGGSADAAFTIRMINKLFDLGLTIVEMQDYAKRLGSDCTFFIENVTALATGKGDQLEPVKLNLPDQYMVIVKPDIHISTHEAYSWIKPAIKEKKLKELIKRPIGNWRNLVINDFEDEVMKRYSVIKVIRDELYQMGATYASLTGSGSAVYGIFHNPVHISNRFQNYFLWTSYNA